MDGLAGPWDTIGPLAAFTCFFLFFCWMLWDGWRHLRPAGRLRRGVPVWRRDLDVSLVAGLSDLPAHTETDWGWARRDGRWLLVRVDPNRIGKRMLRFRTSWPYVALIHLHPALPRITYQQPLGMTLFILPHLVMFFPFVALMGFVNHRFQAPAIDEALLELAGRRADRSVARGPAMPAATAARS